MLGIGELALTALTALIPVATDGVKALANRLFAGAGSQPSNFQEYLQLQDKDIEKLKALAELDKPDGNVSRWVSNLRGATRYVLAAFILIVWAIVMVVSLWVPVADEIIAMVSQLASMVFFYLYGDRAYSYVKGVKSK